MRKQLYWLSDAEWKRLEPLLPRGRRGAHRVDDRRVISGIMHMLRSGARWRDCPPEYGPYTTIYNRFNRWSRRDKAYDANSLRQLLAEQRAKAVIPSTASRNRPIPYDKSLYRKRNVIERMFARLKDFRRLATRYDKLARNFLAGALIVAAVVWWLN